MSDAQLSDLELHSIRRELAQSFDNAAGCALCPECRQIVFITSGPDIYVNTSRCGNCSRTSPTGAATEGSCG